MSDGVSLATRLNQMAGAVARENPALIYTVKMYFLALILEKLR